MHYNTPVNSSSARERALRASFAYYLPSSGVVRMASTTVFSFFTVSLKTKREYFDRVHLHNRRYVYIYIANVIKSLSLAPARSSTCNTTRSVYTIGNTTHTYIFIFYSDSGFAHAQAW